MAKLLKRQLNIEITKLDEAGNIEFQKVFENSLNVKFNFQKYIGNIMYGSGKVSICGLPRNIIEVLIGFTDTETELQKRRIIKVSAGYEGQQLGLMVNGTIKSAMPSMPPDVWIDCDVINNYEALNNQSINFSTKETMPLSDYINLVASNLGLQQDIRITNADAINISQQNITAGTIFDIVYSITNVSFPIVAYIENETLIVDYAVEPLNNDERYINPIEINKNTGMVGLPQLLNAGKIANITTLLNTSIKTGDIIKVESSQIPSANGLYYVIGMTYNGEFRGNNWYSIFHCRRTASNG